MEFSWFPFSLVATLFFGVAMAFYKLPSAKNHNRFVVTFWSMTIPTVLAFAFFHSYLFLSTGEMVGTALLWGVTFACIVLLQMYALHHIDTNVLFPITTTASLIITVLIGILFFGEHISSIQTLGVILAIVTILLFLYKGGKLQYSRLLIGVGSGIVFISAFNKVLQKIVADRFDIHAFQIYQYLFAAIFSLLVYLILHRRDWKTHIFSGGLGIGSLIGVFSFFGGYSLYLALTKGPFSLITSIHSLYILITALTAYFLFQEKLTLKKILLLFLAIVAVVLIRIG
ncbi:MAG: DMT family transporter [Candidatus Moranbacteria bacterium]|nr:DMT family transporter [Candidatus Moranbacteria bacterium]